MATAAQQGAAWTIEGIYREYGSVIRGAVVKARVPPADRDDAIQEVLLSIERSLPTFDSAKSPSIRGWLYGAAFRTAGRFAKDTRQTTHRERCDEEAAQIIDAAKDTHATQDERVMDGDLISRITAN